MCASAVPLSRATAVASLSLVCFLVLGTTPAVSEDRSRRLRGSEIESLAKIAREDGSVRVLVATRLPARFTALRSEGKNLPLARAISSASESLFESIAGHHAVRLHTFRTVPLVAMEVDEDALRALAGLEVVDGVWEDVLMKPALADSTPLIGTPAQWAAGYTGAGQTIAILDTGVAASHPFLRGRVLEEACFSSTWSVSKLVKLKSACPGGKEIRKGRGAAAPCSEEAVCWHGTHVAGIAAGSGEDFSGVAPEAKLIAVQIYSMLRDPDQCQPSPSPCAAATLIDLARGLEYVYELRHRYPIAAVNLSLSAPDTGGYCDDSPLKPLIDNLRAASIPTIVAAGNDGSWLGYPACISGTISVGNTTKDDLLNPTSNVDYRLSLFAPGTDIVSSIPGGGFATSTGTSLAAAHVAGAWALIRPQLTLPTVSDVLFRLQATGKPILYGLSASRRVNLEFALDPDAVRLEDGGFERPGSPDWSWVPEHQHPLTHEAGEPGLPVQPRSGNRLAWLGGNPLSHDQLRQNIYFPPGRRFSLRLYEQIRAGFPCSAYSPNLEIDASGTSVLYQSLCNNNTSGWALKEVNLPDSLNSVDLLFKITSVNSPQASPGSVFIDDLSIVETGPPDIVPVPSRPSGPQGPVHVGDPMSFEVAGAPPSWGEDYEVTVSWGDGTTSEWTQEHPWSPPLVASKVWREPGTYSVRARARSWLYKSVLSDWSEPLEITVLPASGPDLTGEWIRLDETCRVTRQYYLECTLRITLKVSNTGDETSEPTEGKLNVVATPLTPGTVLYRKRFEIGSIRPGRSKTLNIVWVLEINKLAAGNFIVASLDSSDAIAETDETNNDILSPIVP